MCQWAIPTSNWARFARVLGVFFVAGNGPKIGFARICIFRRLLFRAYIINETHPILKKINETHPILKKINETHPSFFIEEN
jgi:hypothetical protein